MFDEMLSGPENQSREPYREFQAWLDGQDLRKMARQSAKAEELFRRIGITFNVYGDKDGEERLIPFDTVPRILAAEVWRRLEKALCSEWLLSMLS